MTATATPATEREIAAALGREPEVVRTSVVRPNLRYDVELVDGEEARLRTLVRRLHELRGASAIVYARSRRSCETPRPHAARARSRGRPLPRRAWSRRSARRRRRRSSRAASRPSSRRRRSGWGSTSPTSASSRSTTIRSRSRATSRWSAGPAATAARPTRSCSRAAPTRSSCAGSRAPTSRPSPTSAPSTRGCAAGARSRRRSSASEPDPRVLVGMLEQVGLVRRGFDAGRAMQIEVPEPPADAAERIDVLLARYEQEALGARRPARPLRRVAGSAGTGRWPSTSARRWRRTAACATSARRSRWPRRGAGRDRAAAGRRRGRDPRARCSSCAGRSGARAWRRCCAGR